MTTRDDALALADEIMHALTDDEPDGVRISIRVIKSWLTSDAVTDLCAAALDAARADERERLLQRLHDDPDNVADWNDCCRRAASAMEADLRAAAPEAKEPRS